MFMFFRKILLLLLLLFPCSFFAHDKDMTGWVGYEQQFGALRQEFITYGGASAGMSIYGLSVGAGIYGNYGFKSSIGTTIPYDVSIIYGGLVVGYKSPELEFVRFRLNVLLGYGTVDMVSQKTGHFMVAPTFYVDFIIAGELNVSLGVSYRYFHGSDTSLNLNTPENSFAAMVGFSWIGDD